jgi:ATP-dependent protease ClpP protease subunit
MLVYISGFERKDLLDLIRLTIDSKPEKLNLVISSYGGNIQTCLGMVDWLNQYKSVGGKVTTFGIGPVQSSALLLFLQGQERVIAPHSIGMIHNSQWKADASGDYADLTALNRHADLVQGQFMAAFDEGTKKPKGYWGKRLKRGGALYFTAEEMVNEGLADRVGTIPSSGV